MKEPTRRVFLKVLAASAAAPGVLAACSSGGGAAPANVGNVAAGNVSALPVGTLRAIASKPVCIGRDANGVYAMTLICTHEGCDIGQNGSVSANGLACSCHGSRFSATGQVTNGPADAPLQHFEVTVDAAGELTVHTGSAVADTTRLKV
jgi:cytochrome b6-f complex iron-sulfur subunit